LIEARKKRYREKQEQKLERAIEQLKITMENNIKNYDETITQRFSKVVRTTQRTEKQVKEKNDLIGEVRVLKKIFGKRIIKRGDIC
jgi:DNA anti-recombination protein RmuC